MVEREVSTLESWAEESPVSARLAPLWTRPRDPPDGLRSMSPGALSTCGTLGAPGTHTPPHETRTHPSTQHKTQNNERGQKRKQTSWSFEPEQEEKWTKEGGKRRGNFQKRANIRVGSRYQSVLVEYTSQGYPFPVPTYLCPT